MSKLFRILITDNKASQALQDNLPSITKNFHSLAKAEEAYWGLIAKLEGKGNKAKETLDALIEHGNIVEISDVANGDLKWKWKTIRKAKMAYLP